MTEERFYVEGGNHGLWLLRDRTRPAFMRAYDDRDSAQRTADLNNRQRRDRTGLAARYIVKPNRKWEGYVVFDRLSGQTINSFFAFMPASKWCAEMNDSHFNREVPMNPNCYERSVFYVFVRKGGTGFEPTSFSQTDEVSEAGARRVLRAYMSTVATSSLDSGTFIVQSPRGAWTFVAEPPVPVLPTLRTV